VPFCRPPEDDDVYDPCEECRRRVDELQQLHLGRGKASLVCIECADRLCPLSACVSNNQ
jgi:hypothetical protein